MAGLHLTEFNGVVIRNPERRRIRWKRIGLTRRWEPERWRTGEVTNDICNFFCNTVALTHDLVMACNNPCYCSASFIINILLMNSLYLGLSNG